MKMQIFVMNVFVQFKNKGSIFPSPLLYFTMYGIVEYRTFDNNFKKIVTNMQSLEKKFLQKKKHLLGVFSTENWHNLNDRKTPHEMFDCQPCLKSCKWKDALAVFPTKKSKQQNESKTKFAH